jgi:hypothetical protein
MFASDAIRMIWLPAGLRGMPSVRRKVWQRRLAPVDHNADHASGYGLRDDGCVPSGAGSLASLPRRQHYGVMGSGYSARER